MSMRTVTLMLRLAGALAAGAGVPALAGEASGSTPAAAAVVAAEAPAAAADKLIVAFLAPVPEVAPDAAQQAAIARVLAGFSAEQFEAREQASAEAARLGPAALAALRRAAADKDLELARRAEAAVAAIEKAHREGLAAALLKTGAEAAPLLRTRIGEQQRAWARLALESAAAERGGDQEAIERLKAGMAAVTARVEALKALEELMLRPAAATPAAARP
jgi:hypothetical protein